jgi:hypothetical protein
MPEYDPDSQADGRYVVAFMESAGEVSPVFERKVKDYFESHLPSVDADEWYNTDDVVTAFEKINQDIGSQTMEQGGREAAKAVPWPDEVNSVSGAITALQQAHRDAYRNSNQQNPAGNYTFEKSGKRTAHVGFPYAPAFAQGVFKQVCDIFGDGSPAPQLEPADTKPDESDAWTLTW